LIPLELFGTLATVALLSTAVVSVQPGTAHPGDPVLVTVAGATGPPTGTFGPQTLDFVAASTGYQALVALSVDASIGERPFSVRLATHAGESTITGTIDVVDPQWPRRELKVAKKFTSPSKAEKQRSAADQKAFNDAFDVDLKPWLFSRDFEWPRSAIITAPFGDLRLINGKKNSQHFGIDLNGETGADIFAANDGKVVMVRDCFGSGNTVLIHHGGRTFTAYFHLSKFEVKDGATVRRGQRIGRVGKTGRVTGPHLHFGVKVDGRWVNPATIMRLAFFEDPTLRFESASQRPH
jgi:murein DD-endopeptidase MepM/ murein hydrolase activator NlpD